MEAQNATQPASILSALAHETLNAETFDSLPDFVDALKTRAARLRIPYDADAITNALETIALSRRLPGPEMPRRHVEHLQPREDLDRESTTERLKFIRKKLQARNQWPAGRRPVIHAIAAAPLENQRDVDRRRALEMVATEIQASIARCDALERKPCE